MPYKAKKIVLPWKPRTVAKTTEHGNWSNTNFYHSKEWRALRAQKKEINPYCEECSEKKGIKKKMYYVDHIKTIKDGGPRLSLNNLRSLCKPCHHRKTGKEVRARAAKRGS